MFHVRTTTVCSLFKFRIEVKSDRGKGADETKYVDRGEGYSSRRNRKGVWADVLRLIYESLHIVRSTNCTEIVFVRLCECVCVCVCACECVCVRLCK
jgi:hypothetical protein